MTSTIIMLLNQSNQVMLTKVGIFFTFIILLGNIQYVKSLLGFKFRQTFQNIRVSQVFENEIDQSGAQEMTILRQTALLISLWQNIAFPPQENENHVDFKLSDYGLSRNTVRGVISHFQTCKDCAADNAMLIATQDEVDNNDVLRLLATDFPMLSEEDDESWTDYSGVFDGEEDGVGQDDIVTNKSIFPIEGDDSIVLAHTQDWVRKVICDLGVCPFTVSVNKAGIPLGGVRYTVSRARGVDEAFLRFWEDVAALLMSSEKEMSTVLLVFPEIELFGNFELFEAYCDCLNDALCASCLGMESQLQLVFFHPKYQFRDGKARISEDPAANFARRSPWPMINILRTPQVRSAQKGIPTGQVYQQNEVKLTAVGAATLQEMLDSRNWENLPSYSTPGKILQMKNQQPQSQQSPPVTPGEACPFGFTESNVDAKN